jgi:N-formylmaleamate deformylase
VAAPTLILRGAESPLLTAEGAAELAGEIPNARLVEIADAGHHLQLERPDACLAALEPFLRAHHGRAKRRATLGP